MFEFAAWQEPVIGNMFYPAVFTSMNEENAKDMLSFCVRNDELEMSANRFESILDDFNVQWDALDENVQRSILATIDID